MTTQTIHQHPAEITLISATLGLPTWNPRPELGETTTRIVVWSLRELDLIHTRTGGTVTARQIERASSDGSPCAVIEVTVTVDVPGVGPVEVVTDWEPAAEVYGLALPVICALRPTPAAVEPTVQDTAREDRAYWNDRYDD
ncbi:hypothetical protein [Streptomyces platensis]|uniref:hypothetical protein n=1 Tax=Streptomyces platensis TaxID=58346 RepID=UPI00379CECAE